MSDASSLSWRRRVARDATLRVIRSVALAALFTIAWFAVGGAQASAERPIPASGAAYDYDPITSSTLDVLAPPAFASVAARTSQPPSSTIRPVVRFGVAANTAGRSLDDLARAAQAQERGGQSAAGRALQKHGDRAGSIYPKIGSPAERSRVAQEIVEDYLTSPQVRERVRRDGVRIFELPDGRGVSFNSDGSFRGLREPR